MSDKNPFGYCGVRDCGRPIVTPGHGIYPVDICMSGHSGPREDTLMFDPREKNQIMDDLTFKHHSGPLVYGRNFQWRVVKWVQLAFGSKIARDKVERNHRFLEEALELAQSLNCSRDEAMKLVDYVFDRDIGEPKQEVGGVMVTLAALCAANDMSMDTCGEEELDRVNQPEVIQKIRKKQAAKPDFSPLPGKAE